MQYIASYPDLIRALGAGQPLLGSCITCILRARSSAARSTGSTRCSTRRTTRTCSASLRQQPAGWRSSTSSRYGLFEGRTDDPPTPPARPDIVVRAGRRHGRLGDRSGAARVDVATPNIDALAAAGTMYTQAYAAPVCVPSRAMVLSGRWPYRNSVGAVWNNGPNPPSSLVTIAERLRARGYATGSSASGGWHGCRQASARPGLRPLPRLPRHDAGLLRGDPDGPAVPRPGADNEHRLRHRHAGERGGDHPARSSGPATVPLLS